MPTAKYFEKYPDFPSDVPTVDVPVIPYKLIQQNDPVASSELFQALRQYGFFMLDLTTSDEGQALVQEAEAMFDLTNDTLDLDKSILKQYPIQMPRSLDGSFVAEQSNEGSIDPLLKSTDLDHSYKTTGVYSVGNGHKDAVEYFMFSQDDILGNTQPPVPKPRTIEAKKSECQKFCLKAHAVTSVLLNSIDASLGLATGTLSSLCAINKPSSTGVRMIRAESSALAKNQVVTTNAHTDIGAITLVFNVIGGLQIRPVEVEDDNDDEKFWKFIRPRQGCVVVNAGDALVEWTGGVLRSGIHRVHHPPGDQANFVRQSLAYLVRPSRDASMRRLKGSKVIPALADGETDETRSPDDWAAWRVQELAAGRYTPRTTGGMPVVHARPQITV